MKIKKDIRRITISGMMIIGSMLFSGCGASSPTEAHTPQRVYESMQPEYQNFNSTEIPLQFEGGSPYMFLETQGKTLEIHLDTGSHGTIALVPEIVENLHVQYTGESGWSSDNYGTRPVKPFLLPEAKLGGLIFHNLLCQEHEMPAQSPAKDSGIMGLGFLKEFDVLLDYSEEKMVLYRHGVTPDLSNWQKFSFIPHEYGILFKGKFTANSPELTFLLDTGAIARDHTDECFNIITHSGLAKLEGILQEGISVEQWLGYDVIRSQDLLIENVTLHSLNFIFIESFTQPRLVDGFLGRGFFLKYKVFIDVDNSTMYIRQQV